MNWRSSKIIRNRVDQSTVLWADEGVGAGTEKRKGIAKKRRRRGEARRIIGHLGKGAARDDQPHECTVPLQPESSEAAIRFPDDHPACWA
jgi:hypothetical protein